MRNGRPCAIISASGRQYKKDALIAIKKQIGRVQTITKPVNIELYFRRPDNRKRDLDNGLKCILDTITEAKIWQDDSLVHGLHTEWLEEGKYDQVLNSVIACFCKGKGFVEIAIMERGKENEWRIR